MPKRRTPKEFLAALSSRRPGYALLGRYAGSNEEHRFRHSCGAVVRQTPKKVLAGTGRCPCEHGRRGNTGALQPREAYAAKLAARRPGYELLGPYRGSTATHRFRHSCGKILTGHATRVLVGAMRCPCEHSERPRTHRLMRVRETSERLRPGPAPTVRDDAYWRGVLEARHGGGYALLGSVSGESPPGSTRSFRHVPCGTEFEARLDTHGVRCPCAKLRTPVVGEGEHRAWLTENRPDVECVQFEWRGRGRYRHSCGHEWEASWRTIRETRGCPECDGERGARRRIGLEEMRERVAAVDGSYEVLAQLPNAKLRSGRGGGRMLLRHSRCGHEYVGDLRQFERSGSRCPECFGAKPGSTKELEINGKTYHCMGYEPLAIASLLKNNPDIELVTSRDRRMPRIDYMSKKRARYMPDIYIPKRNTIIEVKSPATMGLIPEGYYPFGYDHQNSFRRTKAKARQCIRMGYRFELWLYSNGKRLAVPKNWLDMTRLQMANAINVKIK